MFIHECIEQTSSIISTERIVKLIMLLFAISSILFRYHIIKRNFKKWKFRYIELFFIYKKNHKNNRINKEMMYSEVYIGVCWVLLPILYMFWRFQFCATALD